MSYLLLSIVSYYGTITKPYWIILSAHYGKYNKELLFGYPVFFEHHL